VFHRQHERLRVGVPQSLLYHRYGTLWTSFVEGLGHEAIVGPRSNMSLARTGAALAPDETCLPFKLHLGHVAAIADRCDVVLAPRIASVRRGEENCVRFKVAYDAIANLLPNVRVETYTVDVGERVRERRELVDLGRRLGAGTWRAHVSYERARRRQRRHERDTASVALDALRAPGDGPRLLLVGHAYNVADDLVGVPIVRMLTAMGARPIPADALVPATKRGAGNALSASVYWTYSRELLAVIAQFAEEVDGIVFLMTFPCGPDSLVTDLAIRRLRHIPTLNLVLDDLDGLTGLQTRLESFVDIVAARSRAAV